MPSYVLRFLCRINLIKDPCIIPGYRWLPSGSFWGPISTDERALFFPLPTTRSRPSTPRHDRSRPPDTVLFSSSLSLVETWQRWRRGRLLYFCYILAATSFGSGCSLFFSRLERVEFARLSKRGISESDGRVITPHGSLSGPESIGVLGTGEGHGNGFRFGMGFREGGSRRTRAVFFFDACLCIST